MNAPNAITERVQPVCQCCGEAAGDIIDKHLGVVCGACCGRLTYVEHVLMRKIAGYGPCREKNAETQRREDKKNPP